MVVDTHLGESALRRESETPDVRAVRLDWHEFSAAVEDSAGEEASERVRTAGIQ